MPFVSGFATNLDDDVMLIVGRLVRWWSMVEFTVDSSIRDLLNRQDTRNFDTALIIPFKQRLRLLKDLLAQIVANRDDLAKLDAIINRIASLQNYRDFVVHGMMVRDANRPETHVYMSRIRWRWPKEVRRTYISKRKLFEIEQRIARVNMELFIATAGCHMPGWRPALEVIAPQESH